MLQNGYPAGVVNYNINDVLNRQQNKLNREIQPPKYIRLALTDFHKNKVFYRNCMWLELRQVLKKFNEGNARKFTVRFAFCAHVDVIKIENTDVFL